MERLATVAIEKGVVDLTRTYCVINGLLVKDYVAEVLKKELRDFQEWMEKAKDLENV